MDKVYWIVQKPNGDFINAPVGATPKLFMYKGTAKDRAKHCKGKVIGVRLQPIQEQD